MNPFETSFLYSVGVNSVFNSLGFLFRNQGDPCDKNFYIMFPMHALPPTYIEIPFLFENVQFRGAATTRLVYFTVIGTDAVSDVAIGVFDRCNPENEGVQFVIPKSFTILRHIPSTFSETETLYVCNNNSILQNKQVGVTTVEDPFFNGPNDMIQFMFPQSLLLQQTMMGGISGSPVVDEKLNVYGMIVKKLSSDPNSEPIATSAVVLWSVVFETILPRYKALLESAKLCPGGPNILNSIDVAAEVCAEGVPKSFLGFVGQYVNQQSVQMCSPLQQLPDLSGFVITGFYRQYDIATNSMSTSNLVKKQHDNVNIRLFTPFNGPNKPPSQLYRWISTSSTRCAVLTSLQYTDRTTKAKRVLLLNRKGSLTEFLYRADPTKSFIIQYYIYYDQQWVPRSETICPEPVQYSVNTTVYDTTTLEFPPFIQGNEPVDSLYNMTQSGQPYYFTLLFQNQYGFSVKKNLIIA